MPLNEWISFRMKASKALCTAPFVTTAISTPAMPMAAMMPTAHSALTIPRWPRHATSLSRVLLHAVDVVDDRWLRGSHLVTS